MHTTETPHCPVWDIDTAINLELVRGLNGDWQLHHIDSIEKYEVCEAMVLSRRFRSPVRSSPADTVR